MPNLEQPISQFEEEGVERAQQIKEGRTVECYAFIKNPNGFAIELFESK